LFQDTPPPLPSNNRHEVQGARVAAATEQNAEASRKTVEASQASAEEVAHAVQSNARLAKELELARLRRDQDCAEAELQTAQAEREALNWLSALWRGPEAKRRVEGALAKVDAIRPEVERLRRELFPPSPGPVPTAIVRSNGVGLVATIAACGLGLLGLCIVPAYLSNAEERQRRESAELQLKRRREEARAQYESGKRAFEAQQWEESIAALSWVKDNASEFTGDFPDLQRKRPVVRGS
jgi:hypothetical protein